MTHYLRELLPRQELRKRDERPGRYPTIARTGDLRTGRNNVFYDDSNTIIYRATGSLVNYPTTLYSTSPFLAADLSSSISVTNGSVTKTGVQAVISVLTQSQVQNFSPFIERKLFSQNLNKTSSYYASGSHPNDIGMGFSTNLGSKTAIRIEIPITTEKAMDQYSASAYYINPVRSRFEEIATSRKVDPTFNFSDIVLFDCFGSNSIRPDAMQSELIELDVWQAIGSALMFTDYTENHSSQQLDGAFAATSSQLIDMSQYLSQPFLVEKAIIEVPIKAGQGWLTDQTEFKTTSKTSSLLGPNWAGGPCVTFSLLNNLRFRRDLILSATCIPAGDNITAYRLQSMLEDQFGHGTIQVASPRGFNVFSNPASAVVLSASNGQFTGTVKLNAIAGVANGLLSLGRSPVAYTASVTTSNFNGSRIFLVNPFGRSQETSRPSGRSLFGGEYTSPPSINIQTNLANTFQSTFITAGYFEYPQIFEYQSNKPSPYLLFPTDKLILAASKHKSVNGASTSTDYVASKAHDIVLATGSVFITLYGSLIRGGVEFHDTLNQRLETNEIHEMIGSEPQLDEYDVEYFSTWSGSYCADQLSGTLLSASGDFTNSLGSPVVIPGNRLIWADATNTSSFLQNVDIRIDSVSSFLQSADDSYSSYSNLNTIKKEKFALKRFEQTFSQNERFWDSLIPAIDDIFRVGGTNIYGLQFNNSGNPVGQAIVYVTFDTNVNDTAPAAYFGQTNKSDIDWTKSFPFEPKYSDVIRQQGLEIFYSKYYSQGEFGDFQQVDSQNQIKAQKVLVSHTPCFVGGGESPNFYGNNNGMRTDTYIKLIYGTGDLNTYLASGTIDTISASCTSPVPAASLNMGCTQAPDYRAKYFYDNQSLGNCPYTNVYRGAIIRGWKYGLISGFPFFSRAIFRSNRFGQPRDMLEQRLDSKFFETQGFTFLGTQGGTIGELPAPIQVKFLNSKGESIPPEQTFSSNLDFAATSSLPYFDGNVRNREEPLNISGLGTTVITS